MGQAIGGILPLAIGVAISVLPIIAIILVLITPRARSNEPAFVAGWVLGLVVVGGAVLVIANAAGVSSSTRHLRPRQVAWPRCGAVGRQP